MCEVYLEVTHSDDKPFAANLQLPLKPGDKAARTQKAQAGLLIDYADDGRPIGIEITSPSHVTLDQINHILQTLSIAPITAQQFAPLATAA